MTEQPFSPLLKKLIAVYQADFNRLMGDALLDERPLENAQADVMRGVWLIPEPPKAPE